MMADESIPDFGVYGGIFHRCVGKNNGVGIHPVILVKRQVGN